MSDTIICYKGFDKDWKCRDYQFAVGETYIHDGEVKLCKSGFHACEYPLDIFNYYPPTGQMAICELSGLDEKDDNDSKRAGKTITIKASITIPMLISAAIEYTRSRCKKSDSRYSDGDRSASSATGDQSASSATGDNAIAAAFGLESKAMASKTGIVVVAYWDGERKRLLTGYVGEDGILADTWYRAVNGKLEAL